MESHQTPGKEQGGGGTWRCAWNMPRPLQLLASLPAARSCSLRHLDSLQIAFPGQEQGLRVCHAAEPELPDRAQLEGLSVSVY